MLVDEFGGMRPVSCPRDILGGGWREAVNGCVRHEMDEQAICHMFSYGMQVARHIIDKDDRKIATAMQRLHDRSLRLFAGEQRKGEAGAVEKAATMGGKTRRHRGEEQDVGIIRQAFERRNDGIDRPLPALLGLEEF